jgi:cyclic 2,3-diphosphoglycerate synthetase
LFRATPIPSSSPVISGPYALLLADLVVITLREPPPEEKHERARPSSSDSERPGLESLEDRIRRLVPGVPILRTVLRPWPLVQIAQRNVVFATTAPEPAAARAAAQLESRHHATVAGWTNGLADRSRLAGELGAMPATAEVLVTELRAAAVDVATRMALERGMEVVYCDNRPEPVTGNDRELAAALRQVADLAASRAGTQ